MKTLLSFLFIVFISSSAQAFFGLLGRDQCQQPQSAYPTYQQDTQHTVNLQLQGLEAQRQQMEGQMARISQEGLRLQAGIRGYIHTPWSETMLAHMDNNLDCCAPTSVYSLIIFQSNERRPAGQDLPSTDYEVKTEYPVDPVEPAPLPTYVPPKTTNSCQGYPAQYCSNQWGTPYSPPKPGGGLCLQTGFAATPAWYQAACRNGGKIDPQVCSNPQIAKFPAQYQQCIQFLGAYENNSVQKRQLAAHINEINLSINNTRYSSTTGLPNYTPQSSETKSGLLSGIGSFLGNVISTLGPFMLNQYISYKQQKSYNNTYAPGSRMAKYGPPRAVTNIDGSRSPSVPQPYYQHPQPPPPYYGPRYGYPYTYGGNYGAMLPGYQQGGFGCTPGAMNNGMSLIGTLLGGLGLNLNASASLQSSFGPNGGYVPYQGYLNAYGNQYAGIPPYTFPGYTPPYQPGSIYGTTPTYRPPYATPYGYQSLPNYYSRFNVNYTPPVSLPPYSSPYAYRPTPVAPQQNTYGTQFNSYFYNQGLDNQRMLAENEARMRQRQFEMQYQMTQLNNMNSTYNSFQYRPTYLDNPSLAYSNSSLYYNNYSSNPSAYNQTNMGSLLQALLSGQSAYFNFNMQGY